MDSKFLLTVAVVLMAQLCTNASKVRFDPNIGSLPQKEMYRTVEVEAENISSEIGNVYIRKQNRQDLTIIPILFNMNLF